MIVGMLMFTGYVKLFTEFNYMFMYKTRAFIMSIINYDYNVFCNLLFSVMSQGCVSNVGHCVCGGEVIRTAQCWSDGDINEDKLQIFPRSDMAQINRLYLMGDWSTVKIKDEEWPSLRLIQVRTIGCDQIQNDGNIKCERIVKSQVTKATKTTVFKRFSTLWATRADDKEIKHELLNGLSTKITERVRAILVEMTTEPMNVTTVQPQDMTTQGEHTTFDDVAVDAPDRINHGRDFSSLLIWETQMKFILIGFAVGLSLICVALMTWTIYSGIRRARRGRQPFVQNIQLQDIVQRVEADSTTHDNTPTPSSESSDYDIVWESEKSVRRRSRTPETRLAKMD
jgi:hypothetical protein